MALTGIFQITNWQEQTDKELEQGGKITTAKITQEYNGDVTGSSEITFQMLYGADGTAVFVGFEEFTGKINNRSIQFMLKHDGKFENGVASSKFVIIDSNEQEFKNKTGHFSSIENGQAKYQISHPD